MMHKKIKQITIFLGAIFGFFINASLAFALEVVYPTINVFGQSLHIDATSSFENYACYLFGLGTSIAITISILVIAFGGIYYLVSYGRGNFTSGAKDWIKAGILGLLIIVCASSILYTINPTLNTCNLGILEIINFNPFNTTSTNSNLEITTYQEIPMGVLTENLLTRTINCYGFNPYGDPLQGEQLSTKECSNNSACSNDEWCNVSAGKCNKYFPTYTGHDRADCITQLAEGAQKKAQTIALLSDEIAKLMKQCSCEGKCNPVCDPAKGGCKVTGRCSAGSCEGSCVGAACAPPEGATDCCPPGVKEKIEHGPITIGMIVESYPELASVPSTKGVPNDCWKSVDGLINTSLRDRTIYVAPELYNTAQVAANMWNNAAGVNLIGNVVSDPSLSNSPNTQITNGRNEMFAVNSNGRSYMQFNPYTNAETDAMIYTEGQQPVGDRSESLQAIVNHEMGHMVGLNDLYNDPTYADRCHGSTMDDGGWGADTLADSDIIGMRTIYGQPIPADLHQTTVPEVGSQGGESGQSGGSGETTTPHVIAEATGIEYHGLDEFRCPNPVKDAPFTQCDNIANQVEEKIDINGKSYTVINQKKWAGLNLIQQLSYYKPEIDDISKTIKDDKEELDKARSALASCWLAIPSIDLLKNNEITDQKQKVIIAEKTFSDPQTKEKIVASKYCDGFNYSNSSCFKKCSDMCPDTSKEAIKAYSDCIKMSPKDTAECVKTAYKNRPCLYAQKNGNNNETDPKDFGECLSSCQTECTNGCANKYLSDSEEYTFCTNQCYKNGQCIIDSADKCLFNADNIVSCTNKFESDDQGNINNCINMAYLCKNGSNEYSGYQDCANSSVSVKDYSASYFYDNPKSLKCANPYIPPDQKSDCYNSKKNSTVCRDMCPETQKCPTDSKCGECSCDQIDQAIGFSIPNESNNENVGNEGFNPSTEKVVAHEMVGPECNQNSYNDDPLTFYCETNPKWWNDPLKEGTLPKPMGQERICPMEKEIPVGQTVDNAEKWADNLMSDADNSIKGIQKVIDKMTILGEAIQPGKIVKDYCKCPAKFENDTPICKTDCTYDWWVVFQEGRGEICQDECTFKPCTGSPCEQMTDYISDLWNEIRQFKIDYMAFYIKMVKEPRSDIMKQLTYSRQSTNNCSVTNSAYGATTRLLSCTRVENEIISPISLDQIKIGAKTVNSYCYGTELGKITSQSLTDNWFCCELYTNNPAINRNPIYNIIK